MLLLIIFWALFFFSHSLLASNRIKTLAESTLLSNFRYYRLGYNVVSILFLMAILYILLFKQEMNFVFTTSSITYFGGITLMLAGLILMILSFRNYDLGEFTGIKQLAQKIHHPEKLVVKGLNAYVRNPLYSGIIVLIAGYFIFQPTMMNLVSLVIIYLYIYIGATLEEKKLEEIFGEEYRAYKKHVKMLIPYLF